MRKVLTLALLLGSVLFPLSAKGLNIITTIFPAYDWARIVAQGTDANVTTLLEGGVDMHSFQPTVRDVARLASADVFIFVGGESEAWVRDALRSAKKGLIAVDFMRLLNDELRPEEHDEPSEGAAHTHADAAHVEYDEHVWLSLRKSRRLVAAICEALCTANPSRAERYRTNAQAYLRELDALDGEFSVLFASAAKQKKLVFADRYPFSYFAEDYGLNCYAAFAGCSAETEASFNKIIFLAGKVDALDLGGVFVIENSDKKLANTIIASTKRKDGEIFTLDTMQSVPLKAAEQGASYLSFMRGNLQTLKGYFRR